MKHTHNQERGKETVQERFVNSINNQTKKRI